MEWLSEDCFPRPLFTGYGKDIEETARGVKRGFYLVEFDDRNTKSRVHRNQGFDGLFREYDVTGKNSQSARKELSLRLNELEVNGKVVVIRVKGELEGGKTTDIDFAELRRNLLLGARSYVHFNRFSLTSKE